MSTQLFEYTTHGGVVKGIPYAVKILTPCNGCNTKVELFNVDGVATTICPKCGYKGLGIAFDDFAKALCEQWTRTI